MMQVNILEAKTDFSKLIRLLETKKEDYITVARNGKPVVKITLINEVPVSRRIGIAKGNSQSRVILTQRMMESPTCLWEAAYESSVGYAYRDLGAE